MGGKETSSAEHTAIPLDGRTWLSDTTSLSLVDIAAHPVIRGLRMLGPQLFEDDGFPGIVSWIQRTEKYLAQRRVTASQAKITGDEAAYLPSTLPDDTLDSHILFDTKEAERLGLTGGSQVAVVDDAEGGILTVGSLVGLTKEETVIETSGTAGCTMRCHFPRIGYTVQSRTATKL
ncbi:hypothetical protein BDV98DRAFT_576628 [Pterulicium gracile]|uniref:DUF7962 domain-containing protein n=1 Tax=Pterulicium gracile TaxID=1884261 RepID=A0A5C3QCE7_9AGAR|nr:hypothetical protein BDV98DRAFT_576628 [Pterula gracilis]